MSKQLKTKAQRKTERQALGKPKRASKYAQKKARRNKEAQKLGLRVGATYPEIWAAKAGR